MPSENRQLYLYEAIELRSEYDARIKTIKDSLPESRNNREHRLFLHDDDSVQRPAPGFDPVAERENLRRLETKRRKVNAAIQKANFANTIEFGGECVDLNEALEVRKGLNLRIGELHAQVLHAASEKVIYKEGRDIVRASDASYVECRDKLDALRKDFRLLNRQLRRVAFEAVVGYKDEQ